MTNESEPDPAVASPRSEELAARPAIGALIGGKYRILRALGEGGMSKVFEAENVLTLKRAAIKWLHPRLLSHDAAQDRMLREALATSRIRHRNVVDLYDVVLEGEAVVLVMELLQGELLAGYLARSELAFWQLVRLLLPAMEGVAAAHAVGVVHRDIKPENIFIVRTAEPAGLTPKVFDFGISKTSGASLHRLTASGMTLGTPRYISFEQLRGERDVDQRTDVYSFGVMLYEALVGRAPYHGSNLAAQAIQFITTDPLAPKRLRGDVPDALSVLVNRAIARERDARVASLAELIEALTPFAQPDAYPVPLFVWRGRPPLAADMAASDANTRPDRAPTVSDPVLPNPRAPDAPTALATRGRARLRLARSWPLFASGILIALVLMLELLRAPNAGARRELAGPHAAPRQSALVSREELAQTRRESARAAIDSAQASQRTQRLEPPADGAAKPVTNTSQTVEEHADRGSPVGATAPSPNANSTSPRSSKLATGHDARIGRASLASEPDPEPGALRRTSALEPAAPALRVPPQAPESERERLRAGPVSREEF